MSDQQGQPEEDLSVQILSEQRETNALLRDLVGAATSAADLVSAESQARQEQNKALADQNRHTWRLLKFAIVCIVALIFTVAGVGFGLNRQQIKAAQTQCSERISTRNDIRSAILAGVDEVGRYADLTDQEQGEVNGRVARRVYQTLPVPGCASGSDAVVYENCGAAREAGAAPIYLGDPSYAPSLDPDGDGVACD